MNEASATNGDEAEDPESHLQEVVDDVDLDSATEEDPLTLDPSIFFLLPRSPPPFSILCRTNSLTCGTFSSRPLPLRSPGNLLPGLLVRLDAQALLRCRRPAQPQPGPVLAIGRSATALAHGALLQAGQDCQNQGLPGLPARRELYAYEDAILGRDGHV